MAPTSTYDHEQQLSCEIVIHQAKNVEEFMTTNKSSYKYSKGDLFLRYYLSAGNNKRIQLDTKEIPCTSAHISWNESFSLDCFGVKAPSVKIGMRVRVPVAMEAKKRNSRNEKTRNVNYECACQRHNGGCNFCEGYAVLALVAAFKAL